MGPFPAVIEISHENFHAPRSKGEGGGMLFFLLSVILSET